MKREALRIGGHRGGRSALKEEYDKDRANRKKKRLVSSSSDQNGNEHHFQSLEMKNEMTDFEPKPANFLTSFDSILGMTNLDIIKDITSSWIPEEQVAERVRANLRSYFREFSGAKSGRRDDFCEQIQCDRSCDTNGRAGFVFKSALGETNCCF